MFDPPPVQTPYLPHPIGLLEGTTATPSPTTATPATAATSNQTAATPATPSPTTAVVSASFGSRSDLGVWATLTVFVAFLAELYLVRLS